MTLLCITNGMDGVRSCTIRGQHLSTCGWLAGDAAYECNGCLPRPAEVGLLCRQCWDKFDAALRSSEDLITHLRSIERGAQSIDGVRSTTVVQPTIPQSWLEADSLWMYLAGVAIAHSIDKHIDEPDWPHWTGVNVGFSFSATLGMVAVAARDLVSWITIAVEDVVSRTRGAEAAVSYYREVQRALAMFPMEEKIAEVPHLKCQNCGGTVQDVPPLMQMDDRVWRCETCGNVFDKLMTTWAMKVWADRAWNALTPSRRAELLPRLKADERGVLAEVQRAYLLLEATAEGEAEGPEEAA